MHCTGQICSNFRPSFRTSFQSSFLQLLTAYEASLWANRRWLTACKAICRRGCRTGAPWSYTDGKLDALPYELRSQRVSSDAASSAAVLCLTAQIVLRFLKKDSQERMYSDATLLCSERAIPNPSTGFDHLRSLRRLAVCDCPHGQRSEAGGHNQHELQRKAAATWDLWQGQAKLFPLAKPVDLQVGPWQWALTGLQNKCRPLGPKGCVCPVAAAADAQRDHSLGGQTHILR